MIDVDSIVESLMQASKDSEEVSKEKIKIIVALALKDQCEDNLDIIFKYQNQWDKTQPSYPYSETGDPVARLVKLLFNLITDDMRDTKKEYAKILKEENSL